MPAKVSNRSGDLKTKLRATIEANRISRLNFRDAESTLKQLESDLKHAKAGRKLFLETVVSVLNSKIEEQQDIAANQSLGGCFEGDSAMSGGSCAGSD
jgi:hypothetical protein